MKINNIQLTKKIFLLAIGYNAKQKKFLGSSNLNVTQMCEIMLL